MCVLPKGEIDSSARILLSGSFRKRKYPETPNSLGMMIVHRHCVLHSAGSQLGIGDTALRIGIKHFGATTDKQILDHVRRSLDTIFHASCTCAMGLANDTQAVVDSKARVIGVDALRVVDASALPFLPPDPQSTICKPLSYNI